MAGNPVISALADAQKSQIDTLAARASFISTLRSEQKKAAEKRMDQARESAITVQEARRKAAEDAQAVQADAQKSILAVMPQPQMVRGDRPGIGQSLATSSQGSIGGLESIVQAVSGGRGVQEGDTWSGAPPGLQSVNPAGAADPYQLNTSNPISGWGQLGSNTSVTPEGVVNTQTRVPLQTGYKPLDLINAAVGIATGRFPLSYSETRENPIFTRQQRQDLELAAAQRATSDRLNRARDLEDLKFKEQFINTQMDAGLSATEANTAHAALLTGDDATLNSLLSKSQKDDALRLKMDSERALTNQRNAAAKASLAQAAKANRESPVFQNMLGTPLDIIGGIPAPRDAKGNMETPNSVAKSLEGTINPATGLPMPGLESKGINNQRAMFANERVLVYGVEKTAGTWPFTKSTYGTEDFPAKDALRQMLINNRDPDTAKRQEAADWLISKGLMEPRKPVKGKPKPNPWDVQAVAFPHPNATPALGLVNTLQFMSTPSPELQNKMLQSLMAE